VQRVPEHWLADVNPRGKGKAPAPIYKSKPSGAPEGAVFSSVAELVSWRKLLGKLKSAEAGEDVAAMKRLGTELQKKHPRAFALDFQRLAKLNLLVPELRKPVPDPTFSDTEGARIWSAYRAFLPIGRVLVARASGQSAAESADDGEAWPPAILLRLLGPALSGAEREARAVAQKILKVGSGVPLTRRWAVLVTEKQGPLAG
jgi:hypothetical protein